MKRTPRQLQELRARVVQLRDGGSTWAAIGKQLGINTSYAAQTYNAAQSKSKMDAFIAERAGQIVERDFDIAGGWRVSVVYQVGRGITAMKMASLDDGQPRRITAKVLRLIPIGWIENQIWSSVQGY